MLQGSLPLGRNAPCNHPNRWSPYTCSYVSPNDPTWTTASALVPPTSSANCFLTSRYAPHSPGPPPPPNLGYSFELAPAPLDPYSSDVIPSSCSSFWRKDLPSTAPKFSSRVNDDIVGRHSYLAAVKTLLLGRKVRLQQNTTNVFL